MEISIGEKRMKKLLFVLFIIFPLIILSFQTQFDISFDSIIYNDMPENFYFSLSQDFGLFKYRFFNVGIDLGTIVNLTHFASIDYAYNLYAGIFSKAGIIGIELGTLVNWNMNVNSYLRLFLLPFKIKLPWTFLPFRDTYLESKLNLTLFNLTDYILLKRKTLVPTELTFGLGFNFTTVLRPEMKIKDIEFEISKKIVIEAGKDKILGLKKIYAVDRYGKKMEVKEADFVVEDGKDVIQAKYKNGELKFLHPIYRKGVYKAFLKIIYLEDKEVQVLKEKYFEFEVTPSDQIQEIKFNLVKDEYVALEKKVTILIDNIIVKDIYGNIVLPNWNEFWFFLKKENIEIKGKMMKEGEILFENIEIPSRYSFQVIYKGVMYSKNVKIKPGIIRYISNIKLDRYKLFSYAGDRVIEGPKIIINYKDWEYDVKEAEFDLLLERTKKKVYYKDGFIYLDEPLNKVGNYKLILKKILSVKEARLYSNYFFVDKYFELNLRIYPSKKIKYLKFFYNNKDLMNRKVFQTDHLIFNFSIEDQYGNNELPPYISFSIKKNGIKQDIVVWVKENRIELIRKDKKFFDSGKYALIVSLENGYESEGKKEFVYVFDIVPFEEYKIIPTFSYEITAGTKSFQASPMYIFVENEKIKIDEARLEFLKDDIEISGFYDGKEVMLQQALTKAGEYKVLLKGSIPQVAKESIIGTLTVTHSKPIYLSVNPKKVIFPAFERKELPVEIKLKDKYGNSIDIEEGYVKLKILESPKAASPVIHFNFLKMGKSYLILENFTKSGRYKLLFNLKTGFSESLEIDIKPLDPYKVVFSNKEILLPTIVDNEEDVYKNEVVKEVKYFLFDKFGNLTDNFVLDEICFQPKNLISSYDREKIILKSLYRKPKTFKLRLYIKGKLLAGKELNVKIVPFPRKVIIDQLEFDGTGFIKKIKFHFEDGNGNISKTLKVEDLEFISEKGRKIYQIKKGEIRRQNEEYFIFEGKIALIEEKQPVRIVFYIYVNAIKKRTKFISNVVDLKRIEISKIQSLKIEKKLNYGNKILDWYFSPSTRIVLYSTKNGNTKLNIDNIVTVSFPKAKRGWILSVNENNKKIYLLLSSENTTLYILNYEGNILKKKEIKGFVEYANKKYDKIAISSSGKILLFNEHLQRILKLPKPDIKNYYEHPILINEKDLLFVSNGEIYIYDIDKGISNNITNTPNQTEFYPSVYNKDRIGFWKCVNKKLSFWIVDKKGNIIKKFSDLNSPDYDVLWISNEEILLVDKDEIKKLNLVNGKIEKIKFEGKLKKNKWKIFIDRDLKVKIAFSFDNFIYVLEAN